MTSHLGIYVGRFSSGIYVVKDRHDIQKHTSVAGTGLKHLSNVLIDTVVAVDNVKERCKLILNGFNVKYVHEWESLYDHTSTYICELVKGYDKVVNAE